MTNGMQSYPHSIAMRLALVWKRKQLKTITQHGESRDPISFRRIFLHSTCFYCAFSLCVVQGGYFSSSYDRPFEQESFLPPFVYTGESVFVELRISMVERSDRSVTS